MTEAPIPYRVVYAERVRNALRILIVRAREKGLGPLVSDAVRQIDHRLRLYPQFGEPIIDLVQEPGHVRIGTVGPLVVRYAVYEQRRLVVVVRPISPLRGLGL